MDEHSQTDKPKKSIRVELWVIAITLLGLLALLAVGPVTDRVKTAVAARKLYDQDSRVRDRAVADLLARDTQGRLALLRALEADSTDASRRAYLKRALAEAVVGDIRAGRSVSPVVLLELLLALETDTDRAYLKDALIKAVAEDIRAGRNVRPVVQAAAEALHRGGKYAKDYARVAAEGWAPGLLDERTKKEIIAQALELRMTVRPEYPPGKGMPSFLFHWSPEPVIGMHSSDLVSPLRFSINGIATIDGQTCVTGPWKVNETFGGLNECRWPVKTLSLGRHTVQAKMEVILTGIVGDDGKPVSSPETGWKTTIETPVTTVVVRDDLPPDFLQATVTPELSALVAKAVQTKPTIGEYGIGYGGPENKKASLSGQHRIFVEPPLPIDLAYKIRWKEVETGEEFSEYGWVLLQGISAGSVLVPNEWMKKLPIGKHKSTFRVTLEPDLDAAIRNPEVKAYWPLPIELPPITYEIEIKKIGN